MGGKSDRMTVGRGAQPQQPGMPQQREMNLGDIVMGLMGAKVGKPLAPGQFQQPMQPMLGQQGTQPPAQPVMRGLGKGILGGQPQTPWFMKGRM